MKPSRLIKCLKSCHSGPFPTRSVEISPSGLDYTEGLQSGRVETSSEGPDFTDRLIVLVD